MLIDNYIGIDRSERDMLLYRFTTIQHLLNAIVQRTNTLISPRKWDDPFENALAKNLRLRRPDGSISPYPFRNRAYGQCWTLKKETDAFWRMYVPRSTGVRLRSTIKTLYKSLEGECKKPYARISCFIGRVEYLPEKDIIKKFNDADWVKRSFLGQGTGAHAKTLLLKRTEFEHEAEVRLIYLDPHAIDHGDCYSYPMDPCAVISEITFDPRMEDTMYDTYQSILESYGFTGTINRSALYQVPNIEITV